MSDPKDIDKLFQERFRDFEASPDPALWDSISEKLTAKEQKRDRKGIVFLPWLYKGAGIAAAIVVLFFAGNAIFNTNSKDRLNTDSPITSTKKENTNHTDQDTPVTNADNNSKDFDTNQNITHQNLSNEKHIVNNGTDNSDQQSLEKQENNSVLQNAVNQQNNTHTNNQFNVSLSKNKVHPHKTGNGNHVSETALTYQNSNNSINDSQKRAINTKNNKNINENSNATTVAVTENATDADLTTATNTSSEKEISTETAVTEVEKETEIKKSLLDVINELHELEKENTEVAETKRKKWSISPNAAPTYYNTFSNGSPIDQTFADNTKVGDVNLSYGLNVGYDISKRLTVRSGIHRVDYSYSTKDIALVPSIDGTDLTTIAFKTNDVSFDIKDRQTPTDIVYSQYQLPTSESSIREKQIEGNLNQRMSYIEVPVELKYAVLDKKLGVNVIGGVSTLLLTENSIILDSPELLAELGEATNINDVSFSTNIGVGIDYKFSDQLEFNLEPMLKYQINSFSGNTGTFRPYSVGVYTGVSFRF